ncbi:MAG: O-antigen ligase domain-containing protein [Deltaproteobacteria bacterium]|nr:MAG: O-antigen ligase domain-containing protein [Deltaproteobacteria bacterium]
MGVVTTKFIYQQNYLFEFLLTAIMIGCIAKPKLLTALAVGILLVRPNERMDLMVPFTRVAMICLVLMMIINKNRIRKPLWYTSDKYLFIFIAIIFAKTLAYNPADMVGNFMYIFTGLLLYFAVIWFMCNESGIKLFYCSVAVSCFLICLEPVYYHYAVPNGSDLWNMFHIEQSQRLQAWGMWANPNETALIACLGTANILFITSRCGRSIHYITTVILVSFFSFVIFLTASRAGLASFLLIFFPSIIFIKRKSIKFVTILLILCTIIISQSLTPERKDAEGSTEARGELRARGIQIIKDFPITGVGFRRLRYELGSKPVHNTYLQAFAETGVIGGLFFLIYLFVVGKNLYALSKKGSPDGINSYLYFMSGLYCSTVFYYLWGNQLLSVIFFIIIAQIVSSVMLLEEKKSASV